MANIFRLIKLARTAYKAAPVVIPIGLAVAKYAMDKLGDKDAGKAGPQSTARDVAEAGRQPAERQGDGAGRGDLDPMQKSPRQG